MWDTLVLSVLAGAMGANAVPHFIKGMVGERFPNVLGNSPLFNAVTGVVGIAVAALLGYWAGPADNVVLSIAAMSAGALAMAVFHGLGGAYRCNAALGRPNPPRSAQADAAA